MSAKVDVASAEKACVMCPLQHFNPLDEANECVQIDAHACPAGTAMDPVLISSQVDPCAKCPAGTASPGGTRLSVPKCAACPLGTYSGDRAMSECTACPASFTTLAVGSTSVTACTCASGTFWNRRDDKCVSCPDGAFCPGGLALPVVFEGNYGEFLGSVDGDDARVEAKLAGTYESGEGVYKLNVYECTSRAQCPAEPIAFTAMTENYGVPAPTKDLVRACEQGPANAGLTCPFDREGIACGRCKDDMYGKLECQKCDGGTTGGNVVLLLIFPVFMVLLYRGTTSHGTQRVQAAFVLVSTAGMGAFFMQTVAVLNSIAMTWPDELSWLFDIANVFMFDLQAFSFSCVLGQSFEVQYWCSILVPLYVVLSTVIGFGVTQVLPVPSSWKMRFNQTVSMIGMFMSALYVTLIKVVLLYFECNENPSAPSTLAKFRDTLCDSDERTAGMPAMVIGMLLYLVGFYMAFVWAAFVAPSKWMEVNFREQWKFMLTRWRPAVWYWGVALMSRNGLVAFGGVVSSEPRAQLIYITCVVIAYFSMTAIRQPWRETTLNRFDVFTSVLICLIGMFGMVFVSLEDEMITNERAGLSVTGKEELRDTFAKVLLGLIVIMMMSFGGLVTWCFSMMTPGGAEKHAMAESKNCKALAMQLETAVKREGFLSDATRLIHEVTSYDRGGLANFLQQLNADEHTKDGGVTDTISVQKAKAGAPQTVSA
jgi:hypothetical protein